MAKKASVSAQSTMDVVCDIGNSLVKVMIGGRENSVVVMPHALKMLGRDKFQQAVTRAKNGYGRGGAQDASLFEYEGRYYLAGEYAELSGADDRRVGGLKYVREYYAPLLLGTLLRLFPNGHENLRIMAAFPPGDVRFVDALRKSLGGKHTVKLPSGKEIVYKVRTVLTFDEPVGGFNYFLLASDGKHYRKLNIGNGNGLCVDIGGKISTLVPVRADGYVGYDEAQSVDIGIQDVMSIVGQLLLSDHSNYFPEFRGTALPQDEFMRDCLVTGFYQVGGYEINALDAIADATANIRQRIKSVYENDLGGRRKYNYILVTGGGGGLLYQQLVEHVLNFNPERVYKATADLEKMHLANVYGGNKMLTAMLTQGMVS